LISLSFSSSLPKSSLTIFLISSSVLPLNFSGSVFLVKSLNFSLPLFSSIVNSKFFGSLDNLSSSDFSRKISLFPSGPVLKLNFTSTPCSCSCLCTSFWSSCRSYQFASILMLKKLSRCSMQRAL
jgi:hypothetical protein